MLQHSNVARVPLSGKVAARLSVAFATTFLLLLLLLHFLKPELDPSWRVISEYEIGRYGWLMRLAFFCWAGSVVTLRITLRPSLQTRGGKIGHGWLLLIGIALVGAGVFVTDPITHQTTSTTNILHSLCGAIVILTFSIAASLLAASLTHRQAWAALRGWLVWGTLLLWLSLVVFIGAGPVSTFINPGAGRAGPEVFLGWPNRFMVVTYLLWIIVVSRHAGFVTRQKEGSSRGE